MSFFNELKRRNVIKVAIAYVVIGWLTAQIAEFATENFGAPEWVLKIFVVFLLLGLPIVLIFAWAFEMTPEGIKREKDVDRSQSITGQTGQKLNRIIIGILTVAVAYLLVDKLVLQHGTEQPAAPPQTAAVTTAVPAAIGPSIAVLPFVNMSGDAENEYFSDGLTETLLHMLAQLPELRVAARTSSFAFKGQNKDIGDIAKTLGVAHILEGSVQKANDQVRVTAQLIRADDGFHVWSQSYTRPLQDIFAIQDEIAGDVASALGSSLLSGTKSTVASVKTQNLGAYDSYLKGLEQQAILSYSSLEAAENHFKQSLASDPTFTDARLALVRNYIYKNSTGLIGEEDTRKAIGPLIEQTRGQDPDNRPARALELTMELQIFNPGRGAEVIGTMVDELRDLLFYLPTESFSRVRVAATLNGYFKNPEQAVEVLQAGLLIDPLEEELHRMLGGVYTNMKRLDEAFAETQRAMELAPDNPNIYGDLANIEKSRNNLPAAMEWLRRASKIDPQDHEIAFIIANDLYELNLPEEAERWYARVQALAPGSAVARNAELQRALARNERERALELARGMIADQVENRQGSFTTAVSQYANLMLEDGRAREAYDFLVSVQPEITNYNELVPGFKGLWMQLISFPLMAGFETFENRKAAWQAFADATDAAGIPWLEDPEDSNYIWNYINRGENQKAIDHYLKFRLSRPMAQNLVRHLKWYYPMFGVMYEEPRVAVRLAELDKEFMQMREDVRDMLQQPEWNP